MCVAVSCKEIGAFGHKMLPLGEKWLLVQFSELFSLCRQPQALQTALMWGIVIEKDFNPNLLPPIEGKYIEN